MKKILLKIEEIIEEISESETIMTIIIIASICIHIYSIIEVKYLMILSENKKNEIIKKIELVLNRENNLNKDLILEELKNKNLKDIERYYNKKLFDTEFNIKVIKE